MLDPLLVIACCAGLSLTLSYFSLGYYKVPHNNTTTSQLQVETDSDGDDITSSKKNRKRRVLIVTAHPDDECMFFGPTILHFTKEEKALVYLLCLSPGNYYGLGKVRRSELWNSCQMLGINCENIMLYRCDDLPDDPTIMWPTVRTANIVNQHLHALDIDMVITFDDYGVSGHINHSSIHYAIEHLVSECLLPQACEAYSLDSVNLLRKYSALLDVPLSYFSSSFALTIRDQQSSTLKKAMKCHATQYTWFRKLYMMFSRYVLINTLSRINVE